MLLVVNDMPKKQRWHEHREAEELETPHTHTTSH